jgi:hypothetical protein
VALPPHDGEACVVAVRIGRGEETFPNRGPRGPEAGGRGLGEGEPGPPALASVGEETGIREETDVPGGARLGDAEHPRELADRETRLPAEEAEDAEAHRVPEEPEGVRAQFRSAHIYISISHDM